MNSVDDPWSAVRCRLAYSPRTRKRDFSSMPLSCSSRRGSISRVSIVDTPMSLSGAHGFQQLVNDLAGRPALGLAVEVERDAMPQHAPGDGPRSLNGGMSLAVQQRVGLRSQGKILSSARPTAPADELLDEPCRLRVPWPRQRR